MITPAADVGEVSVQVAEGVATLCFYHPKSNSLPGALLTRLAHEMGALGRNPAAAVIVLRSGLPPSGARGGGGGAAGGSGGSGAFCAGASFQELQAIQNAEEGTAFFMGFARLILAMIRCPKLIITRVHGKAVGGGVGVIAASDYAVALPGASVRLSELAVGIGPFVVGPVIERKIGLAAFTTLAVNAGDWRSAEWAREKGLFAEVRDTVEELDLAVSELASRLAASNPEAMARLKAILWQGTEHWDELLPTRAALSGTLVLSDFTRRALTER